jgi:hypothetical protein
MSSRTLHRRASLRIPFSIASSKPKGWELYINWVNDMMEASQAHASLAHAADLSAKALKAVSRNDAEAAAKLLEEAKKALDEAKFASREILRGGRANDD